MRLHIILILFLFTVGVALTPQTLFALSAAVKSQNDYVSSLDTLRDLKIIIDNFGSDDQKKKFEDIRALFKQSSEKHYAQEFIRPDALTENAQPDNTTQYSIELFNKLKSQISILLDEVAKGYIDRSQAILDSTAKETNDILIEYSKKSGLGKYFYRSIDPLSEKKPYNTEKYHYFKDREALEHYLKNGYKSLQDARTLYNDPDYTYIKAKQTKSTVDLDYLLYKQQGMIKHCRQAKQYGIEIHKILKESALGSIQRKYNITLGTITKYPIYDDRIPEEYKVDAIDNQKLIFKIEKERIGYTTSGSSSQEQQKAKQ